MERGRIQGLPKFFEYPLLSQERVKLWTSNLAGIFTWPVRIKAHQNFWRKGSVGVSRDYPNFLGTPVISGKGKATEFKFGGYIYRVYPNKSPLKFRRKGSVGVSRDCPIFCVPPIISRTGIATDFEFCTNIHRANRNKSP